MARFHWKLVGFALGFPVADVKDSIVDLTFDELENLYGEVFDLLGGLVYGSGGLVSNLAVLDELSGTAQTIGSLLTDVEFSHGYC